MFELEFHKWYKRKEHNIGNPANVPVYIFPTHITGSELHAYAIYSNKTFHKKVFVLKWSKTEVEKVSFKEVENYLPDDFLIEEAKRRYSTGCYFIGEGDDNFYFRKKIRNLSSEFNVFRTSGNKKAINCKIDYTKYGRVYSDGVWAVIFESEEWKPTQGEWVVFDESKCVG